MAKIIRRAVQSIETGEKGWMFFRTNATQFLPTSSVHIVLATLMLLADIKFGVALKARKEMKIKNASVWSHSKYLILSRYEIIYEPCRFYMFSFASFRWTRRTAFRFPFISVFIVSWASSLSWWLHAFCWLYNGIDFWPQWYAAGCGKYINGFTEVTEALIYPVCHNVMRYEGILSSYSNFIPVWAVWQQSIRFHSLQFWLLSPTAAGI